MQLKGDDQLCFRSHCRSWNMCNCKLAALYVSRLDDCIAHGVQYAKAGTLEKDCGKVRVKVWEDAVMVTVSEEF